MQENIDITSGLKGLLGDPLELLQKIGCLLPLVEQNQNVAGRAGALLRHGRNEAIKYSPNMLQVLQFLKTNGVVLSEACDKIILAPANDEQLKSAFVIKALVMSLLLPADTGISLARMNQAIQFLKDKNMSKDLVLCITEFQNCIANVNNIFSSQSGLFFCYYFRKQIPQKFFFSLDITTETLPQLLDQYNAKFLSDAKQAGYENLTTCWYSSEFQMQGDPTVEAFNAKRKDLFQALRPIMLQQLFSVIARIATEQGANVAADLLHCAEGHAFFTAPETSFTARFASLIGRGQHACQLAIRNELENYAPANDHDRDF